MTAPAAPTADPGDERWARVALSFLVEPRNAVLRDLLPREGGAAVLAAIREGRGRVGELGVRLGELDLDALAREVRRRRLRVVVPDDPDWPPALDRLLHPPYCLYVAGDLDLGLLGERSVAVVGSRICTEYGREVATELGDGLARRGWVVVSGAAAGIDAAAHRGALAAEGDTVAVLACGLDRAYPTQNTALIAQIGRTGALVAEVPPGALPLPRRFLARNRLIAALARATVVVEAGLRSGSLSTAREARDLHLPVGAVPGPVTSAVSAGTHQLVREYGADLVTDAAEVLELAAPVGAELAPLRRGESRVTDGLSALEQDVLAAAPRRRWAEVPRLAVLSGVDPGRVPAALAVLEMLGLLERDGDRWRRTASPP
ncbi:DNA-processing protein DprA [Phycicoccus flavus]|uniref:DNA-protecting protein DprA n=1 Tax=Phycicoccus flavus TaxID=2502783 RepID=A0A8T6R0J0_9MICO|nr:DNA-processing protein DprA [Phycicoccus flavus]NHA66980.1 DNA-protecting protein DprA [Phycicoccus flavus]